MKEACEEERRLSPGIDWRKYLLKKSQFTAYKLHIIGNRTVQGLIAIALHEGYVELEFAEKAPNNRKPINEFTNSGELLFAQACLISYQSNEDGYVTLRAKTGLMEYYIDYYGMDVINGKERRLAIPQLNLGG
jgi:hypothetical protein